MKWHERKSIKFQTCVMRRIYFIIHVNLYNGSGWTCSQSAPGDFFGWIWSSAASLLNITNLNFLLPGGWTPSLMFVECRCQPILAKHLAQAQSLFYGCFSKTTEFCCWLLSGTSPLHPDCPIILICRLPSRTIYVINCVHPTPCHKSVKQNSRNLSTLAAIGVFNVSGIYPY